MKEYNVPQPFMRGDLKGKWRHDAGTPERPILTTMGSWDTKEQAEAWVNWNNFGEGLYGEIIENSDLVDPS